MRKAILLAMAAAIVAMFAIPGSASANWTKHHAQLTSGNVELQITGTDVAFISSIGGITCSKTISKVDFEGGTTTGKVTTFEVELGAGDTITSLCQGTGALAGCDVHEALADDLPQGPWAIHTVASDTVSVTTTGKITNTLTGFLCPHTSSVTGGTVHFTVANGETNTTSTAELSGTLVGDIGTSTVTVHVSGTIHVLGTITYGI